MMLLRIIAPHFVAGYDTNDNRIAPIVKYMKGWPLDKIKEYCRRKKWKVEVMHDA